MSHSIDQISLAAGHVSEVMSRMVSAAAEGAARTDFASKSNIAIESAMGGMAGSAANLAEAAEQITSFVTTIADFDLSRLRVYS